MLNGAYIEKKGKRWLGGASLHLAKTLNTRQPMLRSNSLKTLRIKAGFAKQKELAVKAGVATSTISNIETGNARIGAEVMEKLCRALQTSANEILKEEISSHGATGFEALDQETLMQYLNKFLKRLPPPRSFGRLPTLATVQSIVCELMNREKR